MNGYKKQWEGTVGGKKGYDMKKKSLAGNVGSAGCFSFYLQVVYNLVSEFTIQRMLFLCFLVKKKT